MNDKFIATQTNNPASKERNLSIDILKLLLSFSVVGLHGAVFSDFSPFLSHLFVNGLARIAVPVFLIISGFYFFEIRTTKQFINWIKRLLFLYIIWMTIYAFFWLRLSRFEIILDLLLGYRHLWYLIGAVQAFILLWFLRNVNSKTLIIIAALCAIFGLVIQYNALYSFIYNPADELGISLQRSGLAVCFPFAVIGYLINKYNFINIKKNVKVALAGSIILLMLESSLNYKYSYLGMDLLISLYVVCPLLFIYVSNKKYYSNNKSLAHYSTGIYLVHMFVLMMIWILEDKHILCKLGSTPIVIITILLSVAITYFLIILRKKIKYIL
jgi:hypothetical protein